MLNTLYFLIVKELQVFGALFFILITIGCTKENPGNKIKLKTEISFDEFRIESLDEGDFFYLDNFLVYHAENIDTFINEKTIILPSYKYEIIMDDHNTRGKNLKTNKIQLAKILARELNKKGYEIIDPKYIEFSGKIFVSSEKKLQIKVDNDYPLLVK
jgi:hypothetical protein|tara:strand:- start:1781 stop:2254 length:474 start_codon:yes stop_codon:yes gene_type:complete